TLSTTLWCLDGPRLLKLCCWYSGLLISHCDADHLSDEAEQVVGTSATTGRRSRGSTQAFGQKGAQRMSTTVTTERMAQSSPRLQARMAGLVACITTSAGFSLIVLGNLVVNDNAAATAHNILANEPLYRLAVVGDVVSLLYIVYTFLLYQLFRPVNRNLAVVGALFSMVGIAVAPLIPLFEPAALVVLKDARSLGGFGPEQVQATALVLLKVRAQAYAVSLVLFGTYNVLTGYLILKSTFLPRILGALLAIAGVGYLINT